MAPTPAGTECTHRWQLDVGSGGVTRGTCRLCHATRDFTDARSTWARRSSLPARPTQPSSAATVPENSPAPTDPTD